MDFQFKNITHFNAQLILYVEEMCYVNSPAGSELSRSAVRRDVGAGGACGRDESLLGNVPSRIFQLPLDHRQYLRLALITGEKIEVIRDSGISVQRITRDQDRTIKHIDAFAKSFSVFSDNTIYGFLKFLPSLK